MARFIRCLVVLAVFVNFGQPVLAAQLDPAKMCRAGTGRFATDFTVCSAAIASGQYTEHALASLYRHRAKTLRYMNDCPAALKDIDKAIESTAWSVAAWVERSKIHQCVDDMSAALADTDKAIALNEFDFESWRQRGIAQFYLGDFAKAQESLSRSISINSYNSEAYAFRALAAFGNDEFENAAWDFNSVVDQQYAWDMTDLWLYLSSSRAGRDASSILEQTLAHSEGAWPAPLGAWLARSGDAEVVRQAAAEANSLPTALYFMAQHALIAGNEKQAKALFEEILALSDDVPGQPVVERVLAGRALEKL